MSWDLLSTDYTDATWSGYQKYTMISNSDGTVSFVDVTTYTDKENSFFGAKDANAINQALNYIMSMLENGTDLYEEFQKYFETQKSTFESSASSVVENVRSLSNSEYNSFVNYLATLKTTASSDITAIEQEFEKEITAYESEQMALFTAWFNEVKNQLSTDVAGNLQNEITELEERLSNLETMCLTNEFTAPVAVDDSTVLIDDLGYAIVADWSYVTDVAIDSTPINNS